MEQPSTCCTAYGKIDTQGLEALIVSGVPLTILDARSAQWDDGKRIGSAVSLSTEATPEQAAKVIPSKQSLAVVYCSNPDCPASTYLAKRLVELGYSSVLKYEEGIEAWIQSGRKVRQ